MLMVPGVREAISRPGPWFVGEQNPFDPPVTPGTPPADCVFGILAKNTFLGMRKNSRGSLTGTNRDFISLLETWYLLEQP
jgi:hypothetical protein